jgi:methyl-accepting chemotaxis protein
LVEEAAAAAGALQDQAAHLTEAVRVFKLNEQTVARPVTRPTASSAVRSTAIAVKSTSAPKLGKPKAVETAKRSIEHSASTVGGDDPDGFEEF